MSAIPENEAKLKQVDTLPSLASPPGQTSLTRLRQAILRHWDVAVVLGLALILWLPRLSGPIDLRYDAGVYYLLGTSLAAGNGYRISSEPGSPQALQYPPLLSGLIAACEKILRTSDTAVVAQWLRRSYAILFLLYALAAVTLAKRFLPPGLAVVAAGLCLLHHQTIFLYDLLFAELPFAVVAIAFALVAGKFGQSSQHTWWREVASFVLATTAFLLRTAGIALLVSWAVEALTRKRWRLAFVRAVLALLPIVTWQAYVSQVRGSEHYAHPAYEYQRASYQYYNVSYTENALLIDPFKPELGHLTFSTLASRLATNSAQLLEAFGEVVSTSRAQWQRLVNGPQRKLFHHRITPTWFIFVPIFSLAALVIGGFFILVIRKAWLVVLLLLGSVGLVWTTPWPAQFLRYLCPLIAFLDICFILALSTLGKFLATIRHRQVGALGRVVVLVVLLLSFGAEGFTAARLYHFRAKPEAIVFDPQSHHPYRFFAHDETWRAWEKTVQWIKGNASPDTIVATTAPHFCYLLTGVRAVLPPMESDVSEERRLLASVPVSYVIIDKLEFLNVARRYARPAVENDPAEWRLVHSVGGTKTYEHVSSAPGIGQKNE
jgi:hypothetical protein